MNAIQVQCGQCKRRFAAKPHLAGKRVKCPGCKNPIVIPQPNVITSIEVTCSSCSAEFLAESTEVGQHVVCPSCGTLTEVASGQADASFSSADSLSSGDPLFGDAASKGASPFAAGAPVKAAPLRNSTFRVASGAGEPGFLASYWVSGAVALVALIALVLCLTSGHAIVGGLLLLIGLVVAGSGFLLTPPKHPGTSKNAEIIAASVVGVILMVLSLIVASVAKGAAGDGQPANPIAGNLAVLFGMLIIAGTMILFVFLVARFGFSRAASAVFGGVGIILPLMMMMFAPAVAAGPGGRVAGGGGGVPGAPPVGPPGAAKSMERSRPTIPPSFPSLGSARTIAPGVDFHEVRLRVPRGQPGQASKLYVYIPKGSHAPKSLPCVFIASAGAIAFTGMELGTADQPEQIPYAQSGFIVVGHEIDGYVSDPENSSDQQILRAITEYQASDAGFVNAKNAIEFALDKIPAVDPQRLYTAGHSSAACQALLLAEKDARIRACIAYAPVVDVASHVRENLPLYRRSIKNFDALLTSSSPKANESRLRCPVFLFHARDDQVVPVSESISLERRLKASGRVVELVTVSSGGHYDPMISEGIPRAIDWLQKIAGTAGTGNLAGSSTLGFGGLQGGGNSAPAGDDPFAESPFQPSTSDDSSAGGGMTAESGSDDSPFKESPFGGSPFVESGTPSPFKEAAKPSVGSGQLKGLLDKLSSSSVFERRDAIKGIAQIDPESVDSEETRQAVVEQLNELVLGDDHFTRAEAVKALGKWGDASSVSVLLGVLADRSSRGMNNDIYKALGRLKDPASALVVGERLGDFFDRDAAEACLRQMGPVAQDALILVAKSGNKDVCLRALRLLGDVGSEECFDVLREAQRSRDVEIRETGKFALRKIRLRQQTEAGDETDEKN